jgi:tRNA/tmRNA/rRNA uracil-C5-methylase (TrmA/RlmC/RlmD family)
MAVTLRWTETDGALAWHEADRGQGMLTETTALGPVDVPRRAFFQVNPSVSGPMLEYVTGLIKGQTPTYLLDLYCGVGLFALAAGKAGVRHVLGVEWQRAAVRAARRNARRLALPGVQFVAERLHNCIDEALKHVTRGDTMVVVDPPRKGVDKQSLSALARHRPRAIVYVSCAPDTLARDIATLRAGGYRVAGTQLFDMFPRTSHFESVTVLQQGG